MASTGTVLPLLRVATEAKEILGRKHVYHSLGTFALC